MTPKNLIRRGAVAWLALAALASSLAVARPADAAPADPGGSAAAAQLERELRQIVGARDWHQRARQVTFSGFFEADGRVNVMFAQRDAEVAAALKQRLGDRVVLRTGEIALLSGGRANDNTPHYGGARISLGPGLPGCSSGFSLVLPDFTRASVTAMHCFNDPENHIFLRSGPFSYGFTDPTAALHGQFPEYDMIAIRPEPGHTYTNKIYTDPGSPIVRTVVGASDPLLGDRVCASGQTTKAKCDAIVRSTSTFMCHTHTPTGSCMEATFDLMAFSKDNTVVAFQGDSGGPVYTRLTQSGAVANGMIVAGEILRDAAGNPIPKPGGLVYAEKISNILLNFNARVLVSP